MSLPHALLSALIEKPSSGSELAERFDRLIANYWHAPHQQIYKELGKLEAAGLIESGAPQDGRGRKRAYKVLPAGKKELKRWLAEPSEPQALRDEFMVRLRAEAALGTSITAKDVKRHLQAHEQKLKFFREMERTEFSCIEGREMALRHLILKAGIGYEELWLSICNSALELLAKPTAE